MNLSIIDINYLQKKFSQMAVTTYAMESMAYLTALTLDSYEEPDASVEAAIVKVKILNYSKL
jgi:alkylation response protein AidB-like acyl-CoA dehydrogenase